MTGVIGRYGHSRAGLKPLQHQTGRTIKLDAKKKAHEIAKLALEKKAGEAVILHIKKLSTLADYLFICSAESERQVKAIADNIEEGLRKKGVRPLGVEGAHEGHWGLMDYNDVIAHIFYGPVRVFYDLDGLWADAPRIEVRDSPLPGTAKKTAKKGE